jgi:hypothetical protein
VVFVGIENAKDVGMLLRRLAGAAWATAEKDD